MNLRREKMQQLKKEMSEIGQSINSPDIDPNRYSGIRRLRILHAQARARTTLAPSEPIVAATQPVVQTQAKTVDSATAQPAMSEIAEVATPKPNEAVPTASPIIAVGGKPKPDTLPTKSPKAFPKTSFFIAGYSTGASIGIIIGCSFLLLVAAYVAYKYMTWKPKLIARKGYRAVAKSKGISGVQESPVAASSDGILRAGTSPRAATSSSATKNKK